MQYLITLLYIYLFSHLTTVSPKLLKLYLQIQHNNTSNLIKVLKHDNKYITIVDIYSYQTINDMRNVIRNNGNQSGKKILPQIKMQFEQVMYPFTLTMQMANNNSQKLIPLDLHIFPTIEVPTCVQSIIPCILIKTNQKKQQLQQQQQSTNNIKQTNNRCKKCLSCFVNSSQITIDRLKQSIQQCVLQQYNKNNKYKLNNNNINNNNHNINNIQIWDGLDIFDQQVYDQIERVQTSWKWQLLITKIVFVGLAIGMLVYRHNKLNNSHIAQI